MELPAPQQAPKTGRLGQRSAQRAGRTLAIFTAFLLSTLPMLSFLENRLIFPVPPLMADQWNPPELDFEEVRFHSADGTPLHGWYVDHPQPRAHILYCHANGVDVSDLDGMLKKVSEGLEVAIFAFDYRGYGHSAGSPHERGVLEDANAAHHWLSQRVALSPDQLVLMGRSLGGAVAIDLAARNGARGVIVEGTFTNIPDVASHLFWWAPVRWFVRSRFDSLSKLAQYHGPLLLSHGTADELIPYADAQRLFAAAPGEHKQFVSLSGAGHNDPLPAEYYEEVARFLHRLPPVIGGSPER